ncbi:hypothetical protein K7X08_018439 [Anisodus acutangulus]|uniref:Uncharacterized protein n=1 Tax=Anisodus acutangulus TaxID=402998 RepID=A0A9Q1LVP7_9SOLA|nr:hypothetical protein K7X08_018439 [Anisodus acutangulus]
MILISFLREMQIKCEKGYAWWNCGQDKLHAMRVACPDAGSGDFDQMLYHFEACWVVYGVRKLAVLSYRVSDFREVYKF